jgi:hypothetical protein
MANKRRGGGIPPIESDDLRDSVPSVLVERVWRRLETRVAGPAVVRPGTSHLAAWGLALTALTFGAGVWVGRQSLWSSEMAGAALSREPAPSAAGVGSIYSLMEAPFAEPEQGVALQAPKAAALRSRRDKAAELAKGLSDALTGDEGLQPAASSELNAPLIAEHFPSGPGISASAEGVEHAVPSWQRLANGGEYEAGWFALSQAGGFEQILAESDSEQLMLLADIARATGQRQRAIAALRRVVAEFSADPVAPLAAWSLAGLLEKSGDKPAAMEAYAAYRELSPEGDFAEDALLRQIKSALERGDREQVHALAAQYERDFPQGQRSAEVARWLNAEELGAADAGGGPAPGREEAAKEPPSAAPKSEAPPN